MCEGVENCAQNFLSENLKGKENLGDFSVGQVKENTYSIKETVSAGVNWIHLVQDRVKGRDVVNMTTNLCFIKGGEFFE